MPLSAATVLEVRPATGADANGGGFVTGASGTDWSQQAAAQYALTGLTSAGAGNVVLSAAAASDMIGSIAQCISGTNFNAGFFQVTAVSVGVSITFSTNNGGASILTGVGAAGVVNIGGALASNKKADVQLQAGMTAWTKADGQSQTNNTAIATATSGNATAGPITWQGYHTTRGDHDGTRPTLTTATNNIDVVQCNHDYRVFDNFNITSTAGTPGNGFNNPLANNNYGVISNCKISGVKNGLCPDNNIGGLWRYLNVINTEITGCTAAGASISSTTVFDGCYIHGNATYGVNVVNSVTGVTALIRLKNSVVYSNSSGGVYAQSSSGSSATAGVMFVFDRCAIVGNTNDGIQNNIANINHSSLAIENTIIYGNTGYGINITNVAALIHVNRNNAYGSNTSGARNNLAAGSGDVTLTADPFTAKAAHDFSLNATAGGGAACKALGFPGTIIGCVSSGYADIGPQQSQAAAGGGMCVPTRLVGCESVYVGN